MVQRSTTTMEWPRVIDEASETASEAGYMLMSTFLAAGDSYFVCVILLVGFLVAEPFYSPVLRLGWSLCRRYRWSILCVATVAGGVALNAWPHLATVEYWHRYAYETCLYTRAWMANYQVSFINSANAWQEHFGAKLRLKNVPIDVKAHCRAEFYYTAPEQVFPS
jgi:hypothetical protein